MFLLISLKLSFWY